MSTQKKHIKDNTTYVEAHELSEAHLTSTGQIACSFNRDELTWRGEIQKTYIDEQGEAYAYDVYKY